MQKTGYKYQLIARQIGDFIIHLRWHYQILILSGGFWLGGYLSGPIHWTGFLLQFASVHLLLFGGATAYNSYWDKDTGPVGGLKHPPPMQRWMLYASLALQYIGLIIAIEAGWLFLCFYALSMFFFWLYSNPRYRWKAGPARGLIAIGVSTGFNSVILGFLAADGEGGEGMIICVAALGVSLIVLSLYPVSQLFQVDEDRLRGDQTFALRYGIGGVIRFFQIAFSLGLLLAGLAITRTKPRAGICFLVVGTVSGVWIYRRLSQWRDQRINYTQVMRLKYGCSIAFLSFILILIVLNYTG